MSARLRGSLTLFVLSIVAYSDTLGFAWVWDDQRTHIHANQHLMEGDWLFFWSKVYEGLYIPLSYSIWTFIRSISGDTPDPAFFHGANVLLHGCNTVLLFLLVRKLVNSGPAALIAGFIFMLHPLVVESVAWISEFRGLLAMLFSLASILCWVNAREGADKSQMFYVASLILFLAALVSKPVAIALPGILILLELAWYERSKLQISIIATLGVLTIVPIVWITGSAQNAEPRAYSLFSGFALYFDAITFYLTKVLIPIDLSASYGRTPDLILSGWKPMISLAIFFVINGLLIVLKEWKLLAAFLIFCVAILPSSGVIPFDFQQFSNVADRYTYLAFIGVALLIALIYERIPAVKIKVYASFLLIFILMMMNIWRKHVWSDGMLLWTDVVEHSIPQPLVHVNRGILYHEQGLFDRAIEDYEEALNLDPEMPKAFMNRGVSYAFKEQYSNALADYSKAIKLDPDYAGAYYNRAVTFFQTGRFQAAWNDLQSAKNLGYPINPVFEQDLRSKLGI